MVGPRERGMSRYARIIEPGDLVHIIARFGNGEYRITNDVERGEYLRRLGVTLAKTDWVLLCFAIMSSHIHLGALAGKRLFGSWSRPLHSGFAFWLNRKQGRFGTVFAERPKTPVIKPEGVRRLIAYQHNNPVRANIVSRASESTWTSHRAYLGLDAPPSWLDVELGLRLCDLTNEAGDLEIFDRYVTDNIQPDLLLEGGDLREARRELRAELGSAIEISYPTVSPELGEVEHGVVVTPEAALHPNWNIEVTQLISRIAEHSGISFEEMRSPSRMRHIVRARKLVIKLGTLIGLNLTVLGRGLGISPQAAGKLARSAGQEIGAEAVALARNILGR